MPPQDDDTDYVAATEALRALCSHLGAWALPMPMKIHRAQIQCSRCRGVIGRDAVVLSAGNAPKILGVRDYEDVSWHEGEGAV